jgi:MFS family permease
MTQTTPRTYPGGLTRRQVISWRNAIFAIFAICGVGMASWVSRVPSVRDALHASTSEMGLLLFGIAVGSILGLLASSHILARIGVRTTILLALTIGPVGFAVAGFGASFVPVYGIVFAGLALFGAAFSICDVAMNVLGAANERVLGRAIMPIFHAFFSFGTVLGAGLGAIAAAVHLAIWIHMGLIAVMMVITVLIAIRYFQSEHIVDGDSAETAGDAHRMTWRDRLGIWRDPRTILIGLIVLGMAFTEGSANDWLALASVDGHGVTNAEGAAIFGVFVAAMTIGRLAGVKLLDRFGRVPVLRACAALAAVGLLIFIFVPIVWVAIIGVVLWGLGASLGFPVGMSAAADDPKTAGARVSAVATIGYFAFLVGPPVIGFLGQHFGLLHGLLVVLVLIIVAGFCSGAARNPYAEAGRNDELGESAGEAHL